MNMYVQIASFRLQFQEWNYKLEGQWRVQERDEEARLFRDGTGQMV